MGINWAAGFILWKPHVRKDGTVRSLSHVHPFRFDMRCETGRGQLTRDVAVHVGFACHVFTCKLEDAGPCPELYSDDRETRAFDQERYEWSKLLRGIVTGLEQRKCYFVGRENFVSFQLGGTPAGYEYRVFFSVRRRDAINVELIVQSAYLGRIGEPPTGLITKPIRFRVIVTKALLRRPFIAMR